jgi:hypothetical protein
MKVQEFCKAFCADMAVTPVPIGYAIKTPFRWSDGDPVAVYIRRSSNGMMRLEDDGMTIQYLQEEGVDFRQETKLEALSEIISSADLTYSAEDSLIFSEYVQEDKIGFHFLRFLSAINRIQDLKLLIRGRIVRYFQDEVRAFLDESLAHPIAIKENEAPSTELRDYIADFVLTGPNGDKLAVFAANTDVKALESLVLWQEVRQRRESKIKCVTIFETAHPQSVKRRTYSRVLNSQIIVGTLDGPRGDLAQKIISELGSLH